MKKQIMALFLLSMFSGAALVHAEAVNYKGLSELGIQAGGIFFEGNSQFDEDGVYGIRYGYNFSQHWEMEGSLLTGKTQFQVESSNGKAINSNDPSAKAGVLLPTVDALYHFGNSHIRPYVAAGVGILQFSPDLNVEQYGGDVNNSNSVVVQYGAGIKFLMGKSLMARLDARHLINTESSYQRFGASKHDAVVTAVLSFLFSGCGSSPETKVAVVAPPAPVITPPATPASVPVLIDSDHDGVTDDKDQCLGTPAGTKVADTGCPIEVKAMEDNWVLKGVQFDTNSDKIKQESNKSLDEAAVVLKTYSKVRVEIQGHTDNVGNPQTNQVLSEKRAISVKNYLVANGVPAERLETKGYGETHPTSDNQTKEGRAANRRIEFKVLSR